ncbi:MAG: hypothetical protein ACP5I3_05920 [Thermoproteus sp.]
MDVVEEILRKIPRPNYDEMKQLYEELDRMTRTIAEVLMRSGIYDPKTQRLKFDEAAVEDIMAIVRENPNVMVPFFVMVCGFSVRELERLYGIKDVYSLRKNVEDADKLRAFAEAVRDNLKHPIHIETVLYKFYKNWEEHQRRHIRGREAEIYVINTLRKHGYEAGKIKIICKGKEREIDCAVPPSRENIKVAVLVRRGIFRDLVKRAKEYSTEFDELVECLPNVKFVVVYFASPHERQRLEEIRKRIEIERENKRPYDLVILTPQEIEEKLIPKLQEWLR